MRYSTVLLAMIWVSSALTGCDDPSKTFGHSYDECILKNLKTQDASSTGLALQVCQRHFERSGQNLPSADVTGTLGAQSNPKLFEFQVTNSRSDRIITSIELEVGFLGSGAESKKVISAMTWQFSGNVAPDQQTSFYGNVSGPLPSKNFVLTATVKRQIDLAR